MDELVKITLPSGAKLEITPADWEISKALYQEIASEAESLVLDPKAEVDVNLWKNIAFRALSSKKIDAQAWACIEGRCTYNGVRITKDTFQPLKAREDYLLVMFEVTVVNVSPFMKNLIVRFSGMYREMLGTLQSKFGLDQKT